MNLYLAGRSPIEGFDLYGNVTSRLYSYVERPSRKIIQAETKTIYKNLMIDSGAFSVWSRGKVIKVEDYGDFIEHSRKEFHDVKNLYYVNLDVIGNEYLTLKNLEYLEKRGLEVLPVFTYKASFKELDRLIEKYEYVLFGGLVPLRGQTLSDWLDPCFARIMKHYRKTGKLLKVHLLGVTREKILQRYPVFSCDSTSWLQVLRYGTSRHTGIEKKMPLRTVSTHARHANVFALRKAIGHFMKMEVEITNLWNHRGIKFNE